MVTPGAFALSAVRHGTTGVVSDPHEIANVMGKKGVFFMMEDARKVPMRFWFGAPSCVPATIFETNGASLDHDEVKELLELKEINYLAEMMNFPGVISEDREVHKKLNIARKLGKPVDGHAPGLSDESLRKYIAAGISTDHECSSIEEAMEKISLGMKILIREGSAARNLNSLKGLFNTCPEMVMLCSDDLHPEMLRERHINKLLAELISEGYDIFDVIRSATSNPSVHYNLSAGLLRKGDSADFIIVENLDKMNILETWIGGKKVYADNKVLFSYKPGEPVNRFNCSPVSERDIRIKNNGGTIRIIEAFDGKLYTGQIYDSAGTNDFVESDTRKDILKIVVKDRYNDSPPSTGFIKGFGLKAGAFASSVAHDSHNIIAIGKDDKSIVQVINEIVRLKGGLCVSSGEDITSLRLPVAGIMSDRPCGEVAEGYEKLSGLVRGQGCSLSAPFMTLSFMALLVIPDLKIGDKGLFDLKKFEIVSLFV
jgi:adenine deaminase